MKNSFLFKSLIDIFFFFHVLGLFALINKYPGWGIIKIANLEPPQLSDWVLLAFNVICYFIFLRGLFFLRRLARIFLSHKYFTKPVALNMRVSGDNFLYAGILAIAMPFLGVIFDLSFKSIYKSFPISPVFLIIVGLFFIIQSKTLVQAIRLKSESDLTI